MITNIIPFPSIERLTCHKLKQHAKYAFYNPQTVNFRGTIKLNGAHADLINYNSDAFIVQSCDHILDIDKDDSSGIAAFFSTRQSAIIKLFSRIKAELGTNIRIFISGVLVCSDAFVIVAIKIEDAWVDMLSPIFSGLASKDHQIYNVYKQHYNVEVDMSHVSLAITKMKEVAIKTNDDEFSRFADGIVWTCAEYPSNTKLWFTTK